MDTSHALPAPAAAAGEPTVGSLAAERSLGLRVLVGDDLGRPVTAAHTSELRDPGPWLRGGELLMTTGLTLDTDPAALVAYVDRLCAAGVACLAVGTGAPLTHAQVPAALVQAAQDRGLPLLEVPERTPFLAVTEKVYSSLAAARYAEQVRALEGQRVLTAAAVHPGGAPAVAAALADLTGLSVLVTDAAGKPLGAAGDGHEGLAGDLRGELDRLRTHGISATASVVGPGRDVRVQPLGSRQLRGFVVCGGTSAPGPFERQLVAAAVVLLTLELERLRGATEADRRRRSDVATALLAAEVPERAAQDLLASVGLEVSTVRAAVLHLPGSADRGLVLDALAPHLPLLLATEDDKHVVLLVGNPPPDLLTLLDAVTHGAPAGLGCPVRPGAAVTSARQAERAGEIALATRAGCVDVLDIASIRLLLTLDADASGTVATFVSTVLGPLDALGVRGETLARSVHRFLESNGSWEEAAAHLGVHRHTLRQRLRRVEGLTGRRMDSGTDRMELLLAFQARALGLGRTGT